MNNHCKMCRLRDGCLSKCKEAEVYEQGYNDAVEELKNEKNNNGKRTKSHTSNRV